MLHRACRLAQSCLRLTVCRGPFRSTHVRSIKGIQPVASVQLADGTVWRAADGGGGVTRLLQQALQEQQTVTDMRVGLSGAQGQ